MNGSQNMMKFLYAFIPLLLHFYISSNAQEIHFNEVMSSNTTFMDEDGDTPDWFELHNYGNSAISLSGFTITDDKNDTSKWVLPDISIQSQGYLAIWASGKNRNKLQFPRTLINQGDEFRYILPASEVDTEWLSLDFDDNAWATGNSGFGYADGDDATILPVGTQSIFMRKVFNISDISLINELILDIDFDDAFVAYINGIEIARANINGNPPTFNAPTISDHEALLYQGGQADRFSTTDVASIVRPGDNILCIQAHNVSTSSSDFTLIPFISAYYTSVVNEGIEPPAILGLSNSSIHTNFKISSKGETLYLYDPSGNLLDSLQSPMLPDGISFGLRNSTDDLVYFNTPSPGQSNSDLSFAGINAGPITFSQSGGPTSSLSLNLISTGAGETIRYTLDSSIPDETSAIYSGEIAINSNQVVRAKIFKDGFIPSSTQTETYLLNTSHDISIVSLVTEEANLFDPETGIYVLGDGEFNDFPFFGSNIWEDWERPVNFTLYDANGTFGVTLDAGIKIFGGWSRAHPQRSFSIFARGRYGSNSIEYPLFPTQDYSSFQALVLRNSGNDFLNSNLRDITLTSLMKGTNLETQAYRHVATYINGNYWGFYNMREKINEHYLASRYNLDPDSIDLLETNGILIHGSNQEYINLIDFVSSNSIVVESNYNFVSEQIDIDNMIIYQIAQIYFDNTDWPGNNNKYWKAPGRKWRWILFDTDFGFGIWNQNNYLNNTLAFALESNGPGWPNPPWSTLLFRKLMQNEVFRYKFINRFADELNSRFKPNNVQLHIDSIASNIASEIPDHFDRWGGNFNGWNEVIDNMKNFASNRPVHVKQHIINNLNTGNVGRLTLKNSDPTHGTVKVNSLFISESTWTGDYFQGIPIHLTAIAKPGFMFSHWSDGVDIDTPTIEVRLSAPSTTIMAHFVANPSNLSAIVINEINYNSTIEMDSDDWFELYNSHEGPFDLSGWQVKDNDDSHIYTIPEGTIIDKRGYLVVSKDLAKFNAIYPNIQNTVGNFDFGLSSSSDAIRLFDPFSELQDIVTYSSNSPWFEGANGLGSTLELINPSLDNEQPENWNSLNPFGSPGESNFIITSKEEDKEDYNFNYYPNPFTETTTITFDLKFNSEIHATLCDLSGSVIDQVFSGKLKAGKHHINKDLGFIQPGVYILVVNKNGHLSTFKWIKIDN